jgi:prepilin-type processing-associated H-X9-DG protein
VGTVPAYDAYYRSTAGNRFNSWQLWYSSSSYAYNQDVNKLSYSGGIYSYVPRKGFFAGPKKDNVLITVGITDAPLVTDTYANSAVFWSWIDFPPAAYIDEYVNYAFRHNGLGVCNVLFWDGHAAGRRKYSETGKTIWARLFTTAPDGTYAP